MPPRVRNAVLMYLLFVAWGVFLFANYPGSDQTSFSSFVDRGRIYMWAGGLHALPFLLATWAALSDKPLFVRLPNSIGVGAALGLCVVWGDLRFNSQSDPRVAEPFLFLGTIYAATFCLLLFGRLGLRWTIISDREFDGKARFTVVRPLTWMLCAGVLLGLAKATLPVWPPRASGWPAGIVYSLEVAALGMPLLVPAIGLALGARHRLRWGTSLLVLSTARSSASTERLLQPCWSADSPGTDCSPEQRWRPSADRQRHDASIAGPLTFRLGRFRLRHFLV